MKSPTDFAFLRIYSNHESILAKEMDHAMFEMLHEFAKEQVEDEASVSDNPAQVQLAGDVPGHLFSINH